MKKQLLVILLLVWFSGNLSAQTNVPKEHDNNARHWSKKLDDPNAKFTDIQKEAEDYFKNKSKGKGSGYKQYKRWEYFNQSRLLPGGYPADANARSSAEIISYNARRATLVAY